MTRGARSRLPEPNERARATADTAPRFTAMRDDAITVTRRLLGQRLVRVLPNGQRLAGIIVEVEAYLGPEDRGAHTFGGRRTPRNESMYLPGGHAYVYFTYGMHFCLNVVCGRRDHGTAVLLRALEPVEGLQEMFRRRPKARKESDLCSGPGKLTQALAIDRRLDGENLITSPTLFIEQLRRRRLPAQAVLITPRIGLNPDPRFAGDWAHRPLRFVLAGHPSASKPVRVNRQFSRRL
jgi:DNA-3-methyladenine glycosylase